jgi:hypothetical protein
MKINNALPIQPKQPGVKNNADSTAPKADFNTILMDKVGKTDGSKSSSRTNAAIPPFTTTPINPISLPDSGQVVPLVERIDQFVDLLDGYRQKLVDPRASLREIQPLLNDISAAKEKLVPEMDSLNDGNALKEVLKSSLVTATTEIMRFNRGDYID